MEMDIEIILKHRNEEIEFVYKYTSLYRTFFEADAVYQQLVKLLQRN